MFEGGHLFSGKDPEHQTYRSRAHLASIIGLLGQPPPEFVPRGSRRAEFFSEKGLITEMAPGDTGSGRLTPCTGDFNAGIPISAPRTLDEIETNLQAKDKELFLQLMRKMLQWVPERRSTAKELLRDPWLKEQL